MTDVAGKHILVVGATGELGGRIARRLDDLGAELTLTGTSAGGLADLGIRGRHIVVDLRTQASTLVPLVVQSSGRLDGVVVAAGVVAFGAAADLPESALADLFAINATGPMLVIASAVDALTASAAEGADPFIVTISGIVAERPIAGMAAYSASKAALAAFSQAAGRELRRSGVRVIDARPGHTETGLATRAIAGDAPPFPAGLDPDRVVDRIVAAIGSGERDLPSSAFEPN